MKTERRPIKTRSQPWARALALWLVRRGMSPNQMSLASVACALLGLACYGAVPRANGMAGAALFLIAAAAIQVRLLANMLDGLMAVEGGRQTKTGLLYNECPDRLADAFFLVGAGYATGIPCGPALGWLAALLAVLTAYLRVLGGSCGLAQDFCGPMAKPHRMFVLTLSSVAAAFELQFHPLTLAPAAGLAIIAAGSLWTCIRRLLRIARQLNAAS